MGGARRWVLLEDKGLLGGTKRGLRLSCWEAATNLLGFRSACSLSPWINLGSQMAHADFVFVF